jgi:hypothetical protein
VLTLVGGEKVVILRKASSCILFDPRYVNKLPCLIVA